MTREGGRPELSDLVQIPRSLDQRRASGHPLRGQTPSGQAIEFAVTGRWSLLVFLSSTCDGCLELWDAFTHCATPLGDELALACITRTEPSERAEVVAALAGSAPVVMTEAAWRDYQVDSGPFFVVLDPRGTIAAEGVAWSLEQIRSALAMARSRHPEH